MPPPSPAEPALVGDLHLDRPILARSGHPRVRQARLLARLHSHPLGEVVLTPGRRGTTAGEVAREAWAQIGDAALAHLASDGLGAVDGLPRCGLPAPVSPQCLRSRWATPLPRTTVVIATRDRTESLLRCLDSLDRLDHPDFDVVVVDSAPSTHETQRVLDGLTRSFPLRYVRVDRPGLGLAHNSALPWVTGDVVAFTDDDVEVDSSWLSAMTECFADEAVQCVTGLILAAELETPAQVWLEQSGGFARGFCRRDFSLARPPGDRLFPFTAGQFGSGANMAFRTDWLRGVGGFDSATGAGTPARGGDDLLAFLRVVLSGGILVYQPSAMVRHWHRRDYEGLRRQAYGYGVGLGAYLTATLAHDPRLLGPALARAVPAMAHLVVPGSPKNRGKAGDFPSELTRRERAGLVVGPYAYASSRWRYRGAGPVGRVPEDVP